MRGFSLRRGILAFSAVSLVLAIPPVALAAPATIPQGARSVMPESPVTPGAPIWLRRYNGPGNGFDVASSLAVSPDGSKVFVTGDSYGSTSGDDYTTIAYNAATGAPLWLRRYNGPGDGFDDAYSVGVSPDGTKVFVTGGSPGSTSGDDYATIAYNAATAATLWLRRYNGPGNDQDDARSLTVSPDGTKVIVTGTSAGSAGVDDYATIAYDAATGASVWGRRYNGPGNGLDGARAVAVNSDGTKVFVTGFSYSGSTTGDDYGTVAYDASTGATLWVRRYNGPGNDFDQANGIAVSPDGSKVFVTGDSTGSTSADDYATIAYDAATGASVWGRRYNGPGNGFDDALSVGVSPDGTKVIVTGGSVGSTSGDDYATIAYDASTGAPQWLSRYNGPGNGFDDARSVAVSPDGTTAFVTGRSPGSTSGDDYATIAYDASTGVSQWVGRYNGPGNGNDNASSVEVSPDGSKVFVTGQSVGTTSSEDYATIAYSTI